MNILWTGALGSSFSASFPPHGQDTRSSAAGLRLQLRGRQRRHPRGADSSKRRPCESPKSRW